MIHEGGATFGMRTACTQLFSIMAQGMYIL